MSLVATFFGLAAIYASLAAHFLAVLQVLVYAGAIMVLFIFVVMILNREEVAPLALRPMRLLGVAAAAYLLAVFCSVVSVGVPTDQVPGVVPETYGTMASIGDLLFRQFLYPFEAISLLLLVAIVGGVVVSRSHQKEVAALRAADYRKRVEELALHDYPGHQEEPPAAAGGHH
jgi:NADH-quinone oxidoreductase subunit J